MIAFTPISYLITGSETITLQPATLTVTPGTLTIRAENEAFISLVPATLTVTPGTLPVRHNIRYIGGWEPYIPSDEEVKRIREELGIIKKKRKLKKAVKIGEYTQTKHYDAYSYKEASEALTKLYTEQMRAYQDWKTQQLINQHIQLLQQRQQEIEEQDIAYIIAMIA